jgi:DNA-binding YbaB/EbfC family protein
MTKGQGFGFGLGKMKELAEAFKKAQEVQQGAKQLQEEMEIEGSSGDGLVKVVLSGNQEPLRVEISADALAQGAEALSETVTAAMKDAYEKSTATMRERMEELTSGLNLPGM